VILDRVALGLVALQVVLRFCVSNGSGEGVNFLIHALLWAAAAVWLAGRTIAGRWSFRLSGVEIPLAALVVLSVASIPRASYAFRAMDGAAAFATLALTVPLAASMFATRRALLVSLLVSALGALSLYALLQRAFILPELDARYSASFSPEMLARIRSFEVWATFFYPNSFGTFVVLLAPAAIGASVDTKEPRTRGLCLAAAVLGVAALSFTGARGAWIGGLVAAVAFGALLSRRRAVLAACVAVGLVAAVALGPRVMRHHSMEIRATYWSAASKIAAKHPVLGVGLNNFSEHYYEHRDARPYETDRVHNDYLQLLVELGALGLVAYLAFLAMTVRASLRPVEPEPATHVYERAAIAIGAGGGIVAAVVLRQVFLDVGAALVLPAVLAAWIAPAAVAQPTVGPATRCGLLAGLAGACVHALVDFPLYDYGSAAAIFLVAGLLATGRAVEAGPKSAAAGVVAFAAVAGWALVAVAPGWLRADGEMADAHLAMRGGRRPEESGVREAAEANPHDAEPWAILGLLRGDEQALARAVELRPRHAPYHEQLAQVHERHRRFEAALASYERSLALHPTRADGQYSVARMLDQLGRTDHAVAHYRLALEYNALAGLDRQRLSPYDLVRALARTGRHDELVALLRRTVPRADLEEARRALGADPLVRDAIDRAVAEASRP
jgi:O-antigen ligase